MSNDYKLPKEGDLYMVINSHGHTFELKYGYYEETDREYGEPVVIYPDLKNSLIYTKDGYPLVTAVQVPCEHYEIEQGHLPEECCSDCIYYIDSKNEIDVCLCEKKRKPIVATKTQAGGDEK